MLTNEGWCSGVGRSSWKLDPNMLVLQSSNAHAAVVVDRGVPQGAETLPAVQPLFEASAQLYAATAAHR
jgi:hypothetical protein